MRTAASGTTILVADGTYTGINLVFATPDGATRDGMPDIGADEYGATLARMLIGVRPDMPALTLRALLERR